MTGWFKSSYSGGDNNCVEVAHNPWHTASYSGSHGECVEVSEELVTGVRDTQNRELSALFFDANKWPSFLSAAKHHSC